jgi:hypothetical protein
MKKIFSVFRAALLSTVFLAAPFAFANKYQDWWSTPTPTGQGFNIGQQGNTIFIAWFTFDTSGESMWVTVIGDLSASNTVTGDVLLFKGPALGTALGATPVTDTKVGTATFTFTSLYTGRVDYTISSFSGSLDIQRFTFQPLAYAGQYFVQTVGGSDCTNGTRSYAVSTNVTLAYDGTTLRSNDAMTGGRTCDYEARVGSGDFLGSLIRAVGAYSCNDGDSGRWQASFSFDRTGDQVVMIRRDVLTRASNGCVARQTAAGPSLLR